MDVAVDGTPKPLSEFIVERIVVSLIKITTIPVLANTTDKAVV